MRGQNLPDTSNSSSMAGLANAIGRLATIAGDHGTAIPELTLHRRHSPTEPLHCIYVLGLGVIAQGDKQVLLREEVLAFSPGRSMLTTIDLPVISHVTEASAQQPFLGLQLTLDARSILQLASEMAVAPSRKSASFRALSVEPLDAALLDALIRLVRLLNEPALVSWLAPPIQQEIMVRLLAGPHGPHLRDLVSADSPSHQIAKAVTWLKQNFTQAMDVDELADRVHMSPSTFRQHFRAIAGVSPLQYQKQLRLQEARQLMLNQSLDAGSAGGRVGYESASQFSREYARLFGQPPQRDIQRMRLNQVPVMPWRQQSTRGQVLALPEQAVPR